MSIASTSKRLRLVLLKRDNTEFSFSSSSVMYMLGLFAEVLNGICSFGFSNLKEFFLSISNTFSSSNSTR
jgi:hypothetical protein